MAKKSFKENAQSLGGLNSIIQNTTRQPQPSVVAPVELPRVEQPPRPLYGDEPQPEVRRPSSEAGCKTGDTRKTFILRKELVEKMLDVAYWEPGKLKDHMNAALEAYISARWTRPRPENADVS